MPSIRTITTSGSRPSITQLALGDLAINTHDGKAYLKKQQGTTQTVVEIGSGVVPISASYATNATTASYAANGGVTQIIAGTNITISPLGGTGAVTINTPPTFPYTGSAQITGSLFVNSREIESPRYISVYSDQTQTLASDLAETPMTFNITDINYGFSTSGSSGFVIQKAGRYNIQFSAQVYNNGSGNHNAYIWLRKNNINISQTNGRIKLKGNGDAYVGVWNYIVDAVTDDKYELIWSADDTTIQLLAENPPVGGPIPSVIITIDQIV